MGYDRSITVGSLAPLGYGRCGSIRGRKEVTTVHRGSATLLALLASGVALWWLLSEPVLVAFAEAMHGARFWQLAMACAMVPVIQGVRASRFSLLATGRLAAPSWPMYVIASRLLLFNYLLPFKLGEVSFPLMMSQAFGTDHLRSIAVLIVARLADLCVVSAMLVFSAALVIDPARYHWNLEVLLAVGTGALALPLVGFEMLAVLWGLSGRLPRLAPWVDRLVRGAAPYRPLPQRAIALGLTVAIWMMQATLAYLAATAVVENPGFFEIMLANAAANLAFALPVSGLAGLGAPQAAWATTLHLTGLAWPPAIIAALICHGVLLIGALGLGVATFLGGSQKAQLPRQARRGAVWAGRSDPA